MEKAARSLDPGDQSFANGVERSLAEAMLRFEVAERRSDGGALLVLEPAGDGMRVRLLSRHEARPSRRPDDEVYLVPDFAVLEGLARQGVGSDRVFVLREEETGTFLRRAMEARAHGLPIRPLRPHAIPHRCLVVLPTYNERENLTTIIEEVLRRLDADVLVIDDASPDGTGEVADEIARSEGRVRVLHRSGKLGLGTAYIEGFRVAMAGGYGRVFEMDSDFSHSPADLPRLAQASQDAHLVIGSRYVPGGSTQGWSFHRRLLSRGANLYARTFLGFRVRDYTTGLRCYDVEALKSLDLSGIAAHGYAFQIEMVHRFARAGRRIREIPIHFVDRRQGTSKMSGAIAREALWLVPRMRFRR
jgi:dolichol-phosphate mannosyltransferase